MITVQKIKKTTSGESEVAEMYFKLLATLNGFHLKPMEIKMLVFLATVGSISIGGNKKLFSEQNENCSNYSINNIISSLYKKGLLSKNDGRTSLKRILSIDFKNSIILQINLDVNKG